MFLTFSSYSGDRRSSLSVERADNVLDVIERQTRKRQQMIQVSSLLMMFMYIYNGKGCNPRDTTVSEGVDQEEQP
jgi:hypothetical protein